jgi:hypothetical protein
VLFRAISQDHLHDADGTGLIVSSRARFSSHLSLSAESPDAAMTPHPPASDTAAAISPSVMSRMGPWRNG